jgi:long-subunit fatty acid transport protein
VAGLTFGPQVKIHSKANYLSTTYFGDINTATYYSDTIEYEQDKSGSLVIPFRTGAGVTVGKTNKWMAGADFMWQNWENFKIFDQPDSLLNAWHISAGAEYIPNNRSISSYFQRMSYRLGFHYGKTPLNLKNKHIDEIGISFGLGFPIRKSRSTVNASFELGKRGTTKYGLIRENYIRFTLGVNIFENWFIKSKYF